MPRNHPSADRLWIAITANLGTKLISVAIAIVLWMIVFGSRSVEVTKEVPLEVITPSEVISSTEIPDHIAFRLSGPKAFLRAVLDRKETPIRINLAGAKPGIVTYRFSPDNIRLPIGIKILDINPASISFRLEPLKHRDVPVKVEIRGALPEGLRIARTEVRPPTVRIRGAESRVDSVTELATVPVDVTGVHQNVDREIPVDLSRYNIQLEGTLPHVIIEVEPVSANFRIKNVDIHVISSYKSKLEEKTVNVLVRADPKDLKELPRSHIYGVIDLSGKPKGKYSEPVKVTLPPGVGLVKVVPDHVNVTLY